MKKELDRIVHVFDGPWYGPAENAFNTINKDLPQFSHVVADVSPLAEGFEPSSDWCDATEELQLRADQHVVPVGDGLFENAFRVILYRVSQNPLPDRINQSCPSWKTLNWTFGGGLMCQATATPYMGGGGVELYPMLDYDRLIGLAGRVTKPTLGIFWDPYTEDSLEEVVHACCAKADEGSRIVTLPLVSRPGSKAELVEKRWRIGYDWMFCSLCDAVVVQAGSKVYPYLMVCCMMMGKPCVACSFSGGFLPEYAKDRVTCLLAHSPEEASSYASWLMEDRNRDKARKLGSAAQFSVARHDKDANLLSMRNLLFGT